MMVTTCFSLMIIYTPEVYPTYARGMAVGLSRAVYRVGSAGVPFLSQVSIMQQLCAVCSMAAALCVCVCGVLYVCVCVCVCVGLYRSQLGIL